MFNPSCRTHFHSGMGIILAACVMLFSMNARADVKWKIVISPSKSGEISWTTSSPSSSGVLASSGTLSFNPGSFLDLTFSPQPGYRLISVYKNADDWTPWLDSNRHYRFGPVENPHVIVARFELISPTGSYDFGTPETLPEGVAEIFNGTGHYSGVVPSDMPIVGDKAFDADIAMDESGKLDIMPNSLEGYTPDTTANTSIAGMLKTRDDKPQVTVSAKFKGEFEGENGEGSGVGTLSDIKTLAQNTLQEDEQTLNSSGSGSYNVKLKSNDTGLKVNYKEQETSIALPVTTDANRNWSFNVAISQEPNAKGKQVTYAQGTVTLPTGDIVSFPKRIVKYSKTKGYKIQFSRGTNMTSGLVDKKTKLSITNMLFDCLENNCVLNDGQVSYQFLGQKGKGNLSDFMTN